MLSDWFSYSKPMLTENILQILNILNNLLVIQTLRRESSPIRKQRKYIDAVQAPRKVETTRL